MTIFGITGGMLRAARSLTGLSRRTVWEGSSGAIPNACVRALHRVVAALEAEGIEFRPNVVSSNVLQPTMKHTVLNHAS
jgi:hypothetical protein